MIEREKKYWLHRISHFYEIAKPMLNMGYLTYGFSDIAIEKNFIERATNENAIENIIKEKWGSLPRNKSQLFRFLLKTKKGDWVVVPLYKSFALCEILDDKAMTIGDIKETIYDVDKKEQKRDPNNNFIISASGKIKDLGLARRIRVIESNISRDKFADAALVSRMKARQTNLDISDLAKSIGYALECKRNDKPISFSNEIAEAREIIQKQIISKLTPDKFERLVKWYFLRIGASNVDIPSKNNSEKEGKEDVDIIATFESLRTIYYVQAKHHSGTTGEWAVSQINGVKEIKDGGMSDEYNRIYWVLSSSDAFSDKCKNLAQGSQIQLINGKDFSEMLLNAGLSDVDKIVK